MVWVLWAIGLTVVTFLSAYIVRRWPENGFSALLVFYTLYLLASQVLATRIVAFPLGFYTFYAPGAVFLYPFTAQALDMINETYGLKAAHRAIALAFISQMVFVVLVLLVKGLSPAPFYELEEAWQKIFAQSIRIVAASWLSFLACQVVDAHVFSWLKGKFPQRAWLRSMGSDLLNLTVDSILFVFLAFYGTMPVGELILGQVVSKNLIGLLDTPWFLLYRRLLLKGEVAFAQAE